ncbi:hypothetical protein OG738_03725 [Amycolatopsis sp. NBC_01488]|uniref:hypothetical protein n=1 Tax=Amycolatopsis sp. NBC_01488 TaxID=2903563 RepID=UPI002E2D1454|nr:hypothetical protein [Amycolatopsis sp. NBC_01488]
MNAIDNDGYQATVDIKWHEIRQIDADSLFPSCHDMFVIPAQGGIPPGKVFHASVVEASATFPSTNGFTWPDSKSLTFSLQGGNADSLEGLAVTTCTDGVPNSSTGRVPTDLSPQQSSHRYMFVDSAEKTPDNPSGASKTDTLIKSRLSLVDLTLKKCSGTGLDDVIGASLCRVSYQH